MTKSLNVLPNPALKPKVTDCALLEGNIEEWIVCCSQRFGPLARRITRDDSLAEDALQTSWIKVLQSINHAYFNRPVACPWVAKIVANTAKNINRQRYHHPEIPLVEIEAPDQSPETLAQEKQLLVLLREMISLLPETYRQVIDFRIYKGFSAQQTLKCFKSSLYLPLKCFDPVESRRQDAPKAAQCPHSISIAPDPQGQGLDFACHTSI